MSDAPYAPSSTPGAPSRDDCTMAMLAHLLAIFTGFLGPLVIWLIKRDQSAFVDLHGKEALNFELTFLIATVVSALLIFFLVGCFLLPVIVVCAIVCHIQAALAANNGRMYRYPLTIRFVV